MCDGRGPACGTAYSPAETRPTFGEDAVPAGESAVRMRCKRSPRLRPGAAKRDRSDFDSRRPSARRRDKGMKETGAGCPPPFPCPPFPCRRFPCRRFPCPQIPWLLFPCTRNRLTVDAARRRSPRATQSKTRRCRSRDEFLPLDSSCLRGLKRRDVLDGRVETASSDDAGPAGTSHRQPVPAHGHGPATRGRASGTVMSERNSQFVQVELSTASGIGLGQCLVRHSC